MPRLDFGNISAQHLVRLVDALAKIYDYQTTIPNPLGPNLPPVPNPETRMQFVVKKQRERWKFHTRRIEHESNKNNVPPPDDIQITD